MRAFMILMLASFLVIVVTVSGCWIPTHGHYHHRHRLNPLEAAVILTAAVAWGVAVAVSEHDDHHHSEYCGCPRRWHDSHWVYYYQSRWEYFDQRLCRWYRYED